MYSFHFRFNGSNGGDFSFACQQGMNYNSNNVCWGSSNNSNFPTLQYLQALQNSRRYNYSQPQPQYNYSQSQQNRYNYSQQQYTSQNNGRYDFPSQPANRPVKCPAKKSKSAANNNNNNNDTGANKPPAADIPDIKLKDSSKGLDLMRKMGYEEGGLGKGGQGIKEPIPFAVKRDRKGLGAENEKLPLPPSKNSRKRQRKRERERALQMQMQVKPAIDPKSQQQKQAIDPKSQQQKQAIDAKSQQQKQEKPPIDPKSQQQKQQKTPIDPKSQQQKQQKTPIDPKSQQQKQAITTKSKETLKKIKTEPEDIYSPFTPSKADTTNHSPIRPPSPSPPNTPLKHKVPTKPKTKPISVQPSPDLPTPPVKRSQFFLKDTATPQQLNSIAQKFREEIELLKSTLTTEKSSSVKEVVASSVIEYEFVVAKIHVDDKQPIAEHFLEFIRTEIVGWIGKYQYEQLVTPIFHCLINNVSHITIVCENAHAYECLEQCVDEISTMGEGAPPISISRLPQSIRLCCLGAVYSGIIHDPDLFLTQVKLHKKDLKADRWIVIWHEVRSDERQTDFMFLMDEKSALALTYRYYGKLFICMQFVEFTNHGTLN